VTSYVINDARSKFPYIFLRLRARDQDSHIYTNTQGDHIEPQSNLCLSFIPHPGPPVTFKYFEVGEFGGSGCGREREHGNAASLHTTCPGIPLDPKVLTDKEVTEVEWLEIEFTDGPGTSRHPSLAKAATNYEP